MGFFDNSKKIQYHFQKLIFTRAWFDWLKKSSTNNFNLMSFLEEILKANLNQQINLIEPRRRSKIQKLLAIKKKEIFDASPQLALKSVQTEFGTVKFTQNDAQKVTKNNKMKEISIQPQKRKKKSMSCKERKEKKIFKLPKKMNYEKTKSLNILWNKYMIDLSKSSNLFSSDSELLLKADFHGWYVNYKNFKLKI